MKARDLKELEKKISYKFQDFMLLRNAVTHSSFSNEHHLDRITSNERLEFLGDAVLEVITSEFLYNRYPTFQEGELTKKRAGIVCEKTLASCAREINLGSFLQLGKGEDLAGGRMRASIISDAMEALIGSIYLDGGFASAKEFVHQFILSDIENKQLFYDSKTILQEMLQSMHENELSYRVVREEGPDHNKQFVVEAVLGEKILAKGKGSTKKAAEQEAAYHVIVMLKKNEKNDTEERTCI